MVSYLSIFCFISFPRLSFFDYNFALVIVLFFTLDFFYPPRRDHLVIPYGLPFESLCVFFLPLEKVVIKIFIRQSSFSDPCIFLMWRTDGRFQKRSLISSKKFQMKFAAYKFVVFQKFCEILLLSERIPTSSLKSGVFFKQNSENLFKIRS